MSFGFYFPMISLMLFLALTVGLLVANWSDKKVDGVMRTLWVTTVLVALFSGPWVAGEEIKQATGTPAPLSELHIGDVYRVTGSSSESVILEVGNNERIFSYENADELPSWVTYDSFYRTLRKARVNEIREKAGNPAPSIYWVSV